jgi:hypothetical protein
MNNSFWGVLGISGQTLYGGDQKQAQQFAAQQQYGSVTNGLAKWTQNAIVYSPIQQIDTNDGILVFYGLPDSTTIPAKKALLGKFYE